MKAELAALAFADGGGTSFANLKEPYAAKKAQVEKSLTASEEKLVDDEHQIEKFEHNRNTLDELATMVDEAEIKLRGSEEHVRSLKHKVSKQSHQLLEKDASLAVYRERDVVLEQELAGLLVDFKRLTKQHTADEDFLDGVCTELALHKKASQQRVLTYFMVREKLSAGKAVVETEFSKFSAEKQAKIYRI